MRETSGVSATQPAAAPDPPLSLPSLSRSFSSIPRHSIVLHGGWWLNLVRHLIQGEYCLLGSVGDTPGISWIHNGITEYSLGVVTAVMKLKSLISSSPCHCPTPLGSPTYYSAIHPSARSTSAHPAQYSSTRRILLTGFHA